MSRLSPGTSCLVPTVIALSALFTTASASAAAAGDSIPSRRLAHADLQTVPVGERLAVRGVTVDDGVALDLELERFEILATGARVVVGTEDGDRELEAVPLVLLRGTIQGEASSRVFLGVSPFGTYGFMQRAGGLLIVSTGRHPAADGQVQALRIARADELPEFQNPFVCGVDAEQPEWAPLGAFRRVQGNAEGGVAGSLGGNPPCRVATVAIETDYEFTNDLFGGNSAAATAYALTLMAGVNEIYVEELNARLLVGYLRLWESDIDPYDPQGGDLLVQFREQWAAVPGTEERNIAHMLSGRQDLPYGGVAYLSVLCDDAFGYGLSGYLNGSFPYPLQDNVGGNWDIVVVAHELGHNFGTLHTHDGYEPPLDNCGNGDCSNAAEGTIMSYCHTCPGGIANIRLGFRNEVIATILAYLGSGICDLTAGDTTAVDDVASTYEAAPVIVDVLLNDLAASCEPVTVALGAFDAVSAGGGTVELVPAEGPIDRDRLSYLPPADLSGEDYFLYTLTSGASATVQVSVATLRTPDATGSTASGAAVSYYQLQGPASLPDFDGLTPIGFDVVPDVNFPSTGDVFATSGLADEVGAVFSGFVTVPQNGLYTFFTESDDGSALFIGDELVVSNDGLHGMVEEFGSIALQAGSHAIKVEFFENGGGAGLIVSMMGPDLPKQPIAAAAWSHSVPCASDLNRDGSTNVLDLVELIVNWGVCPVTCAADLNGDGTVDVQDLVALIVEWGPCGG